ncbi:MAG: Ig-like domain-containing protein [Lachnospiraceae bacterium]|nr:Ig-like domain-containing protein [Lachnospiraceae bacterium]
MKSKKVVSGLLSLAMVATSVFTGDMTAVKAEEMPTVLAHFDFDEEAVDGVLTGTNAKATVSGATINTEDKVSGAGALSLDGSSFIEVKNAEDGTLISGQEEITISYYSKSTAAPGWAFFINKDSNSPTGGAEYYLGILDRPANAGGIAVERYSNGRVNSANTGTRTADWTKIDVVYGKDYTTLYVNGVEASTQPAVTSIEDSIGTESVFYIGKATWGGGEYFTGLIDDYTVYAGALTAAQVRYAYDGKTAADVLDEEGFTVTPAVSMLVGEARTINVTIPSIVEGATVTYASADEAVATVDETGKVTGVKAGTTTVTTTVTLDDVVKTQETAVTVEANENVKEGIAVEYDLTGAVNGQLVDLSGRGNHATIHDDANVINFATEEDGTPYMEITDPSAYLDLPMSIINSLSDPEEFTIEATYTRSSKSTGQASWLFCFGSIPKSAGTNYMFYSPYFGFDGTECVRAGIKDTSNEELFKTSIRNENDKYYTIDMVFDNGNIRLFMDGVKVGGEVKSGYSIMDDVVTPGTQNDILGYIGKSCWQQDTNFMGKISSFKIYDKVLTDEDVQLSRPEYQKAFQKTLDESLAVEDILGSNESAEEVVYNLNLLATVNENEVVWTSSDEAVITANGTVHNGTEDKVVELKATMTSGALVAEKKFTVTVKAINKAELESLTAEVEALKSNVYVDESSKTTLTRLMASAAEATSQTEIDSLVSKIKKAMESVTYVESYADPFKSIDESKIAGSMEVAAGKTVNMYTIPESLKDMVKVAYASDDATVATVSDAGVITGVKAGYTRVTLTVTANSDGFAMEYQTLVKVTSDAVSTTTTAVSATAATTSLVKAGTTQIVVTAPANATISYRAKGAVSVNKDGKVTGKKGGNGTVYVVVEANGKKVVKKVAFTVADITGKSSVRVGKKLTLKVAGISGKVTWSVDKKKLATIKNGKLTAKKKGKVVVTAKVGNVTLKKTITIKKK